MQLLCERVSAHRPCPCRFQSCQGAPATVTPEKTQTGHSPLHHRTAHEDDEGSTDGAGFLADGVTPRKRAPATRQHSAMTMEWQRRLANGNGIDSDGNDLILLSDGHCRTIEDYWELYKTKFEQLELNTNGAWRKDIGGKRARSRARSQWWTQRSPMFRLVEYHLAQPDATEQDALKKVSELFDTVEKGKNGKPKIKDINRVFKKELNRLNIALKGRPKKKKRLNNSEGARCRVSRADVATAPPRKPVTTAIPRPEAVPATFPRNSVAFTCLPPRADDRGQMEGRQMRTDRTDRPHETAGGSFASVFGSNLQHSHPQIHQTFETEMEATWTEQERRNSVPAQLAATQQAHAHQPGDAGYRPFPLHPFPLHVAGGHCVDLHSFNPCENPCGPIPPRED